MVNRIRDYLPLTIAGVCLAGASLFPETWLGLLFALATATLFALTSGQETRLYRAYFVSGFVFTGIAFYWLPSTMELFGGMPTPVAALVQVIFCATSALQFVLAAWILRRLRGSWFDRAGLALPVAWMAAELLFPRLFPWAIGHALIIWTDMAGLAEFWGVPPMGALLMVWGECLAGLLRSTSGTPLRHRRIGAVFGVTLLLFAVGHWRSGVLEQQVASAPRVSLGTVQGNLSVQQKGDARFLEANIDQYVTETATVLRLAAEIVVWPETVVTHWLPERMRTLRETKLDALFDLKVPLLFGALSFRERSPQELSELLAAHPEFKKPEFFSLIRYRRFNSAFGIDPQGTVLGAYHKRALMPFGEYVPFSEMFPSLKLMLPQTGDFAVGDLHDPIIFSLPAKEGSGPREVRIAPLICYEDLVPSLSREAVLRGANLLVNLTNDAWYGETMAPYQHHLLAQWRAVESRRYFLRSTNTGFTALVSPFGRTIAQLPTFQDAYFVQEVRLLDGETVYAHIGDIPAWIICVVTVLFAIGMTPFKRGNKPGK